jgi:hypothetical protein
MVKAFMLNYTLTRTGQTPLKVRGEKIACVYGHWHYGIHWGQYHNLVVYRTEDCRYVLSIQYRTSTATTREIEQPHDYAVKVNDINALAEELGRYDPLAYLLHVHRPHDGEDSNFLRRRYQEQVAHLLELVGIVEEGRASPPLIQPVMIDYSRIDPEVQEAFELSGIEQAISGQEWLRRSEERTMEDMGEGGASVIVYEPEDEDDEDNN